MSEQNPDGQAQHVIASPNPTIKESESPGGPDKVRVTKVESAQPATAAPMKTTTKSKPRTKRRSKPQND